MFLASSISLSGFLGFLLVLFVGNFSPISYVDIQSIVTKALHVN